MEIYLTRRSRKLGGNHLYFSTYGLMTELRFQTRFVALSVTWVIFLLAEEVKNAAAVRAVVTNAAPGSWAVPQKIAVIGGGITAAATAAFLKNLGSTPCQPCEQGRAANVGEPACRPAVHIDVFEGSDRLGGRLDFVSLEGEYLEVGGESLNSSNRYMEEFIRMYNADHGSPPSTGEMVEPAAAVPGKLSWMVRKFMFNGQFVPLWSSSWTTELQVRATDTVHSWERLYKMFEESGSEGRSSNPSVSGTTRATACSRTAFNSGLEMLQTVGLHRKVFTSLSSLVSRVVAPPGRRFVESIVQTVYTQNSTVHTLAGLLSIVCALGKPLITQVPHRRVVEYLLKRFADNIYLDCKIEKVFQKTGVTRGGTEAHMFTLEASKCGSLAPDRLRERTYDYVVIAAQLSSAIRIFRQTQDQKTVELFFPQYDYQRAFVTVVEAAAIKEDATLVEYQTLIVTTPEYHGGIGTFLVSVCSDVRASGFVVCKFKSGRKLSDEELDSLFRDIRLVERRDWYAYPFMHLFADTSAAGVKTYPPAATTFELMPGLFHPNAFEGLFSCMEGQAVAARNVAHLIMNTIESKFDEARRASSAMYAEGR